MEWNPNSAKSLKAIGGLWVVCMAARVCPMVGVECPMHHVWEMSLVEQAAAQAAAHAVAEPAVRVVVRQGGILEDPRVKIRARNISGMWNISIEFKFFSLNVHVTCVSRRAIQE